MDFWILDFISRQNGSITPRWPDPESHPRIGSSCQTSEGTRTFSGVVVVSSCFRVMFFRSFAQKSTGQFFGFRDFSHEKYNMLAHRYHNRTCHFDLEWAGIQPRRIKECQINRLRVKNLRRQLKCVSRNKYIGCMNFQALFVGFRGFHNSNLATHFELDLF